MLFSDLAGPYLPACVNPSYKVFSMINCFFSCKGEQELATRKAIWAERPSRLLTFSPNLLQLFCPYQIWQQQKLFATFMFHNILFFSWNVFHISLAYIVGYLQKFTLFIKLAIYPTGRSTTERAHSLPALSGLGEVVKARELFPSPLQGTKIWPQWPPSGPVLSLGADKRQNQPWIAHFLVHISDAALFYPHWSEFCFLEKESQASSQWWHVIPLNYFPVWKSPGPN